MYIVTVGYVSTKDINKIKECLVKNNIPLEDEDEDGIKVTVTPEILELLLNEGFINDDELRECMEKADDLRFYED